MSVEDQSTSAGGSGAPELHERRDTTRKVCILFVDDSVDAAESMCAVLRLFGNDAEMAHDGESAVEMVAVKRPDLVLMDLSLPRVSGLEAGRQVRAAVAPHPIVVVAVTGWGRDEDRAKSLEYGFDAHLTKPVDFEQLKGIIRSVAVAHGFASDQRVE